LQGVEGIARLKKRYFRAGIEFITSQPLMDRKLVMKDYSVIFFRFPKGSKTILSKKEISAF